MLNITRILALGVSLLASAAWSDSSTYAQLYHAQILNSPDVNGDVTLAEQYTDCHMAAMGAFPDAVQAAMYDAANQSHDYSTARQAFSQEIAQVMAAGGTEKHAIESVIEEAKALGDACLSEEV